MPTVGLDNWAIDHSAQTGEPAPTKLKLAFRIPITPEQPYDPHAREASESSYEEWWIDSFAPAVLPSLRYQRCRVWLDRFGLLRASMPLRVPVPLNYLFDPPRGQARFRLAVIWRCTGVGWLLRRMGVHQYKWLR